MSETTSNLSLPYILPQQAQKHVTHNEAIRMLDAMVQLSVLANDQTSPPAAPANGERHIVAAGGEGAWQDRDNQIAAFQDGAWAFFTPQAGWLAWVSALQALFVWNGTLWEQAAARASFNHLAINGATGDTTNRLALNGEASLFNHDGKGHQVKLNKAASAEAASLVFQTGFHGRAEMGTLGDDDFRLKVSSDGASWQDGILIDGATGQCTFPNTTFEMDAQPGGANQELQFNDNGVLGGHYGLKFDKLAMQLQVSGAGCLFNHGGNGHQVKVNKAASGDTASLLFQTGYSGRAEMGTMGNDSFAIKVSDGGNWYYGATIDPATGILDAPGGLKAEGNAVWHSGNLDPANLQGSLSTLSHVRLNQSYASGAAPVLFDIHTEGSSSYDARLIRWNTSSSSKPGWFEIENSGIGTLQLAPGGPKWNDQKIHYSGEPALLASYSVSALPAAADHAGALIYVSDATGGAVPAFSNGTNWLSVIDGTLL